LKLSQKNYKRVVVKIGSSLFYEGQNFQIARFFEIVSAVSSLVREENKEVVIVSSGAIALGMELMKLKERPKDVSSLQALAACGQSLLMEHYNGAFKKCALNCAQLLLTWEDFNSRKRYLNAKNTLSKLLQLGVVPIVNENDTISTDEIKFGDNDRLSALVAALINADLLIMLSDVDGLLDKESKVVRIVTEINSSVRSLACPTGKKTCVGGMITKLEAAKIAMDSGIPCVIANGRKSDIIGAVLQDAAGSGTLFVSGEAGLAARERWIAFGSKPKGKIIVDSGAKSALFNKKSLLSVGVIAVEGNFEAGDVVSVTDKLGEEICRGKAGISSRHLEKVKGNRFEKEIIHRNNLVILQGLSPS